MFKQWRSAPQPLPTFFLLFLSTLAANIVLNVVGASPSRVLVAAFGASGAAIGISLALNLRGTATHQSSYLKTHRLRGVDYSRSYVSHPIHIRTFGLLLGVVGVCFVVAAIFGSAF